MYKEFELSQPIKGKTEDVIMPDKTSIHTITSGEGSKTVLLAHGYGFTNIEWNIIVPQLNILGYKTIVFDQRGHGNSTIGTDGITSSSMSSDYKNLIDHFELKECILIGHSMGGFLSVKFLLDNPSMQHKNVKGCVLMATFAGDINRKNIQNRLQLPLIKSGLLELFMKWKPLGILFGKSILGKNPDPEIIRVIPEVFLQQDHSKLIPIIKAFAKENYYSQLKNITIPCAIVIGEKDATTPPFHTDDMTSGIPNTIRINIKDKGHCLNAEAPEEIVKAVKLMDK